MLHAGLDLSRKKLDVCLLSDQGEHLDQLAVPPDADSLRRLARRIEEVHCQPVCAVIESMTGARIVHDTLEQQGWSVQIADAQKVKGLAPLACKTDKIDSQVLAVLSHRDLVPAIWLPDPSVREERELARFRLHLVKHKSALKCRIHSTLINFGKPCPVTDLFGVEGRRLLKRLQVPGALARQHHRLDRADRRPRTPDRRDQPPPEGGPRRAPLRPAALDGARDRLGPRLHDRRRDRRDRALPISREARRLHGSLSAREPIRGEGSARPIDQARAHLPALGAARGDDARAKAPRLRRALPANQAPAWKAARRQGRPGRPRAQTRPRDLAHAFPQGEVRSPRRRFSSGGLTALFGLAPERTSNFA